MVSLDSMATVPLAAVISMTAGPIFGAAPEMRPGQVIYGHTGAVLLACFLRTCGKAAVVLGLSMAQQVEKTSARSIRCPSRTSLATWQQVSICIWTAVGFT